MPSSHATEGEARPAETPDARHAELEERKDTLKAEHRKVSVDFRATVEEVRSL